MEEEGSEEERKRVGLRHEGKINAATSAQGQRVTGPTEDVDAPYPRVHRGG